MHRVIVRIGHTQIAQQNAAVGVAGSCPCWPVALWGQFGQFGVEPAIFIEQLFGLVALHPAFEKGDVIRMLGIDQKRHLSRDFPSTRGKAIERIMNSL